MRLITDVRFFKSELTTALYNNLNSNNQEKCVSLQERLQSAWHYMCRNAGKSQNFYLLWLERFLHLTIGAGVLAHWKTFSFTQSDNDQVK